MKHRKYHRNSQINSLDVTVQISTVYGLNHDFFVENVKAQRLAFTKLPNFKKYLKRQVMNQLTL